MVGQNEKVSQLQVMDLLQDSHIFSHIKDALIAISAQNEELKDRVESLEQHVKEAQASKQQSAAEDAHDEQTEDLSEVIRRLNLKRVDSNPSISRSRSNSDIILLVDAGDSHHYIENLNKQLQESRSEADTLRRQLRKAWKQRPTITTDDAGLSLRSSRANSSCSSGKTTSTSNTSRSHSSRPSCSCTDDSSVFNPSPTTCRSHSSAPSPAEELCYALFECKSETLSYETEEKTLKPHWIRGMSFDKHWTQGELKERLDRFVRDYHLEQNHQMWEVGPVASKICLESDRLEIKVFLKWDMGGDRQEDLIDTMNESTFRDVLLAVPGRGFNDQFMVYYNICE